MADDRKITAVNHAIQLLEGRVWILCQFDQMDKLCPPQAPEALSSEIRKAKVQARRDVHVAREALQKLCLGEEG